MAAATVPARARGRWCVLTMPATPGHEPAPQLAFEDAEGEDVGSRHYLGLVRDGGHYRTVAYVPEAAMRCRHTRRTLELRFAPVSRALAAVLMFREAGPLMPQLVRFVTGGNLRRARTELIRLSASLHRPEGYIDWMQAYDCWPTKPPGPLPSEPLTIGALVFRHQPESPALTATLDALTGQGMASTAVGTDVSWRAAATAMTCAYVAILQAGEVLAGHAAWFVAAELDRMGRPALAYADEDTLRPDGARTTPVFRPMPGRFLMLSGTLARGVWFVRRDVLLACPERDEPAWAECVRMSLWLQQDETRNDTGVRLPMVLTHRRWDAETAPSTAMGALVTAHLDRTGLAMQVTGGGWPVTVRTAAALRERVSVLVPSSLRSALTVRCLRSVAEDLVGRDVEMVVGVSQPAPLDAEQNAAAAAIAASHVRVVHLPFATFNFSQVCNALAAMTTGAFILLLNDDVSVIAPGWLDEMAAPMGDPRVGIVGARLLYPDRTVQHGGVVMGLSGLCDHASRGLPAEDGRANLLREFSAVTAACLLVRRSIYELTGGLDEAYPSAFNDVDFCLRVGEAGHRVVYAPAAALIHHEMQTYGSHYKGDRAPFQMQETARMRRRWAAVVADDPWHSPNLDVAIGREWDLAFPPRRARTFQVVPE